MGGAHNLCFERGPRMASSLLHCRCRRGQEQCRAIGTEPAANLGWPQRNSRVGQELGFDQYDQFKFDPLINAKYFS